MDNLNEILLSFGVDEKSLNAAVKAVANNLRQGLEAELSKNPPKALDETVKKTKDAGTAADKSSKSFKDMAFSIGLVGYGMENLGRRLLGFSESLFGMVQHVAETTEQLERLKNALIVEGVPEEDRNSIVAQIKRISLLPGGKLQEVTKSFQEIRTAGLGVAESLQLIEGLTKATTISGKGTQGVEQAVKVLRRALLAQENPFKTQTLDTLEAQVGPQIANAILHAFGSVDAKTLNKAGGPAAVKAIIGELGKLGGALPVTLDTVNHIHDSLLRIGDSLLHVMDPALTKILDAALYLEEIFARLEKRFDKLSPDTKAFVSGALAAIPLILAGLGAIISTLGVLLVALAVVGKTWKIVSGFFTSTAPAVAETTAALAESGAVAGETAGAIAGVGSKFAGLSGPIGLAIAAIVAYVTNAGHARDTVNSAFGSMVQSVNKLVEALSKLANGPVITALFDTLSKMSDFLGGVLGDVIATLFREISNLIDVFTQFFGLLTDPSMDKIGEFFKSLYQASLGWMDSLGKLLAASFIEAVAEMMPEQPRTDLKGIVGGSIKNAFTGGISGTGDMLALQGFNKDQILGVASKIRQEVNQVSVDSKTIGGNLDTSAKAAADLSNNLRLAHDEMEKMESSLNSMVLDFSKIRTNLAIDQVKFDVQQAMAESKDEFERLIKADPNKALAQLGSFMSDQTTKAISAVRTEVSSQISDISKELDKAFTAWNELPTDKLIGAGFDVNKLNTFREALRGITVLAKDGSSDLAKYESASKTILETGKQLKDSLGNEPIPGTAKEDFDDFQKKIEDVTKSVGNLAGAVKHSSDAEQDIANNRKRQMAEYKRQIQDVIRELEALDRVAPLKADLESLNDQLRTQQTLLSQAQSEGNLGRAEDINANILEIKNKIADKERDIAAAGLKSADAVRYAELNNNRLLKSTELTNEAYNKQYDILVAINEAHLNIARQGQAEWQKVETMMKDIDAQRIALGLDPFNKGVFGKEIHTRASGQAKDIIDQSFNAGFHPELGTQATALQFTKDLQLISDAFGDINREITLGANDLASISKMLNFSTEQLTSLDARIRAKEVQIQSARRDLENANDSPDETKRKQNVLTQLLQDQGNLTNEAAKYANILKIINVLLAGNLEVVNEDYRVAKNKIELTKAQLQLEQQKLDIQQRLNEAQLGKAQAGLLGGLLPNIAGTQDAESKILATQIELLKNKHAQEREGIELQKEALRNQRTLAGADKKAIDDKIAGLDAQLVLLTQIQAIEIGNLQTEAARKHISDIRNIYENIGSIVSNNFADKLSERIEAILRGFRKLANGTIQPVSKLKEMGEMLKDVIAVGLSQAFQAVADAIVSFVTGQDTLGAALLKAFGGMLTAIGQQIVNLTQGAVALAAVNAFIDATPLGIFAAIGAAAKAALLAEAYLAPITAVGLGLMIAGGLLSSAAQKSVATNSANTANAQTGAKGEDFDPNKDPKTIYQKALQAQILIDIRTDDTQIVKTVIKHVNGNGRLATLIGNRKLQFGY